jgi:hypothetical protein
MNKIEKLPKHLDYKNECYSLRVWVNAWDRLCVGYRRTDNANVGDDTLPINILSFVVEQNNDEFIPDTIEPKGLNDSIGNCKTLDDCIDNLICQIEKFKSKFLIKVFK